MHDKFLVFLCVLSAPNHLIRCNNILQNHEASGCGKRHSFDFICFFVNSRCLHLLNKSPAVQLCLYWTRNKTFIQFFCKSCLLPSFVAYAHQNQLIMDFNFCKTVQEVFLPTGITLLLMFFWKVKRQLSNWWTICSSSFFKYFSICICLSVVNCFTTMLWLHSTISEMQVFPYDLNFQLQLLE